MKSTFRINNARFSEYESSHLPNVQSINTDNII
jgi:hypothetical protein